MWLFVLVGFAVVALAHTAPAPFVLDGMAGASAVWHMPKRDPPTIYLTYDDGPNPATTPDVLDVLAREGARATFFLIDRHVTEATAPIVRRIFAEGHAVGLHSAARATMLLTPDELGAVLDQAAGRIEALGGTRPCRIFRPHAGWRGGVMYEGLRRHGYTLIGWGWLLWDFNWFRPRSARASFERINERVSAGDIVVMHDGDESSPERDQRQTVEATARLVPVLRARGFLFGTVCPSDADRGGTAWVPPGPAT
jgi:peptidoglycan/xylan/chitin deacetylase (PgdA/CDA1 family)